MIQKNIVSLLIYILNILMRIGQKMKELTIEELKEVELNILKDVAKFCEINKIQYKL